MRRWIAVAAVTIATLASGSTAAAQGEQEIPWCQEDDELVSFIPPGYIHVGESFDASYAITRSADLVDLVVSVGGESRPIEGEGSTDDNWTIQLPGPDEAGYFEVGVTWKQPAGDEGGSALCRAAVSYTMRAVPERMRIGRQAIRVDGRWSIVFNPRSRGSARDRTTWRVTPACDLAGCAFGLRDDPGTLFRPTRSGYVQRARTVMDCAGRNGRVRRGFVLRFEVALHVVDARVADRGAALVATRIGGVATARYEVTRAGRAGGCRGGTVAWNLVGVRVR